MFKGKSDQATASENSLYISIGGEATARAIANEFYDIMERDPMVTELLAVHPQPMDRIREVFSLYLMMWLGGPDTYSKQRGHPRLRARHLPFTVTPKLKEQWMYCMRKALAKHVDNIAVVNRISLALDQLADHMVNTEDK